MRCVRLGAVGYLNARPLVYGLEGDSRFSIRYDVPSRCAALLHDGSIDLGLIPSIEYLRGPEPYAIVPGPAIASRGPVVSVALYTQRDPKEIHSIAMDTSSRTSVALATVLARKVYGIAPALVDAAPDLEAMLAAADAALIIGDNALLLDHGSVRSKVDTTYRTGRAVEKIDLGEVWTAMTGLPFVWAFWAGRAHAVTPADVRALEHARDEGARHPHEIARDYFNGAPDQQAIGERYLRDNIKYDFGSEEVQGLIAFYRYAAELELASYDGELRFYGRD